MAFMYGLESDVSVSPGPQIVPAMTDTISAETTDDPSALKQRLSRLDTQKKRTLAKLVEAMAHQDSPITMKRTFSEQHTPKKLSNDTSWELPKRRCLALISHNNMKPAMQEFVLENKDVLQHFRLTGTNSTMTMLRQVFEGMEVEYGPTMSSGPLGGDAQVAALLTQGDLGGMIFFADPLSAHPHIADIHSLIRLANVHDILYACNRTTGRLMIQGLKAGLNDPSLIPSFYKTLESPSVAKYRAEQAELVEALKERQLQLQFAEFQTRTMILKMSEKPSDSGTPVPLSPKKPAIEPVETPSDGLDDTEVTVTVTPEPYLPPVLSPQPVLSPPPFTCKNHASMGGNNPSGLSMQDISSLVELLGDCGL